MLFINEQPGKLNLFYIKNEVCSLGCKIPFFAHNSDIVKLLLNLYISEFQTTVWQKGNQYKFICFPSYLGKN